jgi:transposase
MAKALSVDLRRRVVDAIEHGLSCRKAAERFGVSASSAVRWRHRLKNQGDVTPKKQGGGRKPGRIETQARFIPGTVAETPDITLAELQKKLQARGVRVGVATLRRFFDRRRITFKNVWPAPSASDFIESANDQSATTYPASGRCPRPRWRYARSGPHKTLGVDRRFLNQVSETVRLSGDLVFAPRKHHWSIGASRLRSAKAYAATGSPLAANLSPRRNSAQTIRASLLANATTATF